MRQRPQNRRQQRKPPNPLVEIPTPASVRKESRAATQTKFRPLERAIGAEVRASKQRTKQVGDWWNQYLNEVSGTQANVQAAYDKAGQEQQGFINQAGARDASNTAQLQSEANANAALRGAAPGTEAANREAAAGAQRQYLSAAQGGATAAQGAAQYAYLADKRRIGKGQSIASRQEEMRRTRSAEKDRTDTRGERGAYRVAKEGEGRDAARKYLVERQAFGLNKQKATHEAEQDAIDNRIAQQNANSSTRSSKASAKNANTTAKTAGKLTPSEQRTVQNEKEEKQEGRRNAMATARREFERKKWPSWTALEKAVAKESEVSPAQARKAVARLRKHIEQKEKAGKTASAVGSPFG